MDEEEVRKAVGTWLQGQGFRVKSDCLIDETGRLAEKARRAWGEAEKYVLGWVRAYPNGVTLEDVIRGLSGTVESATIRAAAERLLASREIRRRGGLLHPGSVARGGGYVLPCPVRPDLYAVRGENRVERWSVECKPSRMDLTHGIGQAHLYAKVSDRSFLALPDDWPTLYPAEAKRDSWAALNRTAHELGFRVLRVDPEGSVAIL